MRAAARVGSHLPLPPLLKKLLEAGATEVTAIVTHGLFSRNALELIENSDISRVVVSAAVEEGKHGDAIHARRLLPSPPCVTLTLYPARMQITNTCPHGPDLDKSQKIDVIDVAPVFAEVRWFSSLRGNRCRMLFACMTCL